jgi:hypothetical protein
VRPHLEFRGFVYGHQLRALTQYDDRFYSPDIGENHEAILQTIQRFFDDEVREKLAVEGSPLADGRYVIDFGIIFEREGERVVKTSAVVIEVNPFNNKTGSACFVWEREGDFNVMVGRNAFEFRFITEHQWDSVDYECVVFPDVAQKKQAVKAEIVKQSLSLFERFLAWRS